MHKNKIIHKDIKPANIIINSATRQVKITDFSIASRLEKENQTIANPNLNDSANIPPSSDITSTTTLSTQDGRVLDLTAVMKATQAIASEIVLESLLGKLMKIAIENAGAQNGLLILEKDGELRIKATGSVDTNEFIACPTTPAATSDRDSHAPKP